jgi:hypothetical protein
VTVRRTPGATRATWSRGPGHVDTTPDACDTLGMKRSLIRSGNAMESDVRSAAAGVGEADLPDVDTCDMTVDTGRGRTGSRRVRPDQYTSGS